MIGLLRGCEEVLGPSPPREGLLVWISELFRPPPLGLARGYSSTSAASSALSCHPHPKPLRVWLLILGLDKDVLVHPFLSKGWLCAQAILKPKVGGPMVSVASPQCQGKFRLLPSATWGPWAAIPPHDHNKIKSLLLKWQLSKHGEEGLFLLTCLSADREDTL